MAFRKFRRNHIQMKKTNQNNTHTLILYCGSMTFIILHNEIKNVMKVNGTCAHK